WPHPGDGAGPGSDGAACPPPDLSEAFVVHLLQILRDHVADPTAGHLWLDGCLVQKGWNAADVVRRVQQQQAANQVSIGNCVTSLRLLWALDWPAFFEAISVTDALLRQDPAGVYARQDFATRDRDRQVVEKLARGSRRDELDMARRALDLAA